MSDPLSVIIWWLTIFVIGSIFLPVTTAIFHRFIDRGYIFAKVIGILAVSYLAWLLGSLHLLPFTKLSLVVILLGFTILSLYFTTFRKSKSKESMPWKWFIFEEILFLAALSFWSYVRAMEPSIRSLEKFMDFGFVNSILRTTYFPPADMWLAKSPEYLSGSGYFINYYYFGHLIAALLTKLSAIDAAVTYNLMIATLFAFTFTLPFSIGVNLYYLFNTLKFNMGDAPYNCFAIYGVNERLPRKSEGLFGGRTRKFKLIIAGLLAAFLVSLGGNLHTLYVFTSGYANDNPQPPWQLEPGIHPERYWYPNATRFIPFTIHEFPVYSFVVADLHGHVSDIPMVMLVLALLLTLITRRSSPNNLSDLSNFKKMLAEFESHTSIPFITVFFLGILLAAMYMTNAWDGLIYMVLSGLVFLYLNLVRFRGRKDFFKTVLYRTFSASLFLFFFFLVTSLPFSLNFKPFVSGVGVLCAPAMLLGKKLGPFLFEAGKCQKSPLYQMAILWGFFYFNVIGYLMFVIIPIIRNKFSNNQTSNKFLFWKFKNWKLFGNLPRGKAGWKLEIGNLNPVDIFILLLIFVSTLLLIFPEFFYIKDIYPAHYRANTMFKLGYQAFMMLGIAESYIFLRIKQLHRRNFKIFVFNVFFYIFFFLVAIYPYFAINSFYGNLQTYHGLYGLNWLVSQYPNDYQAIVWMRNNITGQPVIVEANGDSYTDYDRVSANTGLPTIIGWPVHEWLWRGSYDEAGRRIPEVAAIYESPDINQTKQILKKYSAEYIFVGQLEREKYKNLNEKKLESLGKVVFESGGTKVIKIAL